MRRQHAKAGDRRHSRQPARRGFCLPAVLLCAACTTTPVDPVVFVIMREAAPPPGYQAAVDANRITPLSFEEPPALGALPVGDTGGTTSPLPLSAVPNR